MDTTSQKLNMPLVSILMLTYNRAPYIGEAISSVLSQTYQNWRLVIIDDGSTDNTENMVRTFSDHRIAYVRHEQNLGLIARRRESINYAAGHYVAILDSDDYWISPHKLTKQVEFLKTNQDHVLVGTQVTVVDGGGKEVGHFEYATEDSSIRPKILLRNQFTHSSMLIRRSSLEGQTYDQTIPIWEDYDLVLRLGLLGKLANLSESMTAYRRHQGNISREKKKSGAETHLSIIKRYKSSYPNYFPALIKGWLRYLT